MKDKRKDALKEYTRIPYIGVWLIVLFAFTPIISYLTLIAGTLYYGEYEMLGMLFFLHTPLVLASVGIFGGVGLAAFFGVYFSFTRRKTERFLIQLVTGFAVIALIYFLRDRVYYFLHLVLTVVWTSGLKWIETIQKIYLVGPLLIILGGFIEYFFGTDK